MLSLVSRPDNGSYAKLEARVAVAAWAGVVSASASRVVNNTAHRVAGNLVNAGRFRGSRLVTLMQVLSVTGTMFCGVFCMAVSYGVVLLTVAWVRRPRCQLVRSLV